VPSWWQEKGPRDRVKRKRYLHSCTKAAYSAQYGTRRMSLATGKPGTMLPPHSNLRRYRLLQACFKCTNCGGKKCVSDSTSSRKDPLHDPHGRMACGSVLVLTTRLPMSRGVERHEGVLTRPVLRREAWTLNRAISILAEASQ
jgi:hypothetical protein